MLVRLRPDVFVGAPAARAHEWRQTTRDLNAALARCHGDDLTTVTVGCGAGGEVELTVERGGEATTLTLPRARLERQYREYRHVIEQLAGSASGVRGRRDVGVLDYAKRLVHDEAGELVQRAVRGVLEIDLCAGRRLFTLFFLLSSGLPEALVRRHRHG